MKTILITGATSGIGEALSLELDSLGYRLILTGRSKKKLDALKYKLKGADHFYSKLEMSGLETLDDMLRVLKESRIKLNGLVNCAGVDLLCPFKFLKDVDIDLVMGVNLISPIKLIRSLLSASFFEGSSSIVLVSSIHSIKGAKAATIYSASKAALLQFAQSLSSELVKKKIRVNCVSPAYVKTPMFERLKTKVSNDVLNSIIARHKYDLLEVKDVVDSINFLLSEYSSKIVGQNLIVDGGYFLE